MPHLKPTVLTWPSTQILCLKGHVRARGSTLWRHRWQEASEFLCTKTPHFGGSWTIKKVAKKPRKCSLRRAQIVLMSRFQNFAADAAKKKAALRAVLINTVIRINSGPKILRSCFFTVANLQTMTDPLILPSRREYSQRSVSKDIEQLRGRDASLRDTCIKRDCCTVCVVWSQTDCCAVVNLLQWVNAGIWNMFITCQRAACCFIFCGASHEILKT